MIRYEAIVECDTCGKGTRWPAKVSHIHDGVAVPPGVDSFGWYTVARGGVFRSDRELYCSPECLATARDKTVQRETLKVAKEVHETYDAALRRDSKVMA